MPRAGSSIRVRTSGRYEARYRGADGKLRGKTFDTEKEARSFLTEMRAQVHGGTWSDPDLGRQTFSAVAQQWLVRERQGKARASTLAGYERSLRLYAEPSFGKRQIATISSSDLEAWAHALSDVRGRPVMPRTVRYAFFPVQAVFSYAARHRVIRYNPAPDVKLPDALPAGRAVVTGHFLSREQVAAVAAEVGRTEPVYGLLLRFSAGVGLRASETTGLRVRDLRLAARQVDVVRTVKKGHPAGWVVDEPKSKRSSRTVPVLDDELVADLTAHPRRADPDAPLWPARDQRGRLDYGTADQPRYWNQATFYRNVFRPALAVLGLPNESRTGLRWHDLRHTCISQWLEDGHPMYEVSRWAGHSSLNFTDRVYTHIAEQPDYSAALERTRLAKARKAATLLPFPMGDYPVNRTDRGGATGMPKLGLDAMRPTPTPG